MATNAQQASDQQVTQLIQVMNVEQLLQDTIKKLRPQLNQQAYTIVQSIVNRDQLSPEEKSIANELADQLYQLTLKSVEWSKIQPVYQKIYKDVYSAEEVQAQIDFYSSPIGQSILKKTPIVAQESMKIVNGQLMNTLQTAEKDFAVINKKLEALKQKKGITK